MMLSPSLIVLSKGRGEPPTGSNLTVICATSGTQPAYKVISSCTLSRLKFQVLVSR